MKKKDTEKREREKERPPRYSWTVDSDYLAD